MSTQGHGWQLRLASTEDAKDVARIYAPIVTDTAISFELEPPTPDLMARRIKSVLERERPWLVAVKQGTVFGYAYATKYRERAAYAWSSESSICVAPPARRTGVAYALYTCLMSLLRIQGFQSVYAAIALPNPASIGLHERSGFERVGIFRRAGYKHGAWHDVEWWQHQLPATHDPKPPLTLATAQRLPAWSEAFADSIRLIRDGVGSRAT
jgi:L-amino acid N-acyltransferase YncA